MRLQELSDHISATYVALRRTLVVVAIFLPLVLSIGGYWIAREPLQSSMSSYYWGSDGAMRNWFVGCLFSAGALLYVYKGYTPLEDIALKLAGIMAALVALFPAAKPIQDGNENAGGNPFSLHGIFAVSFFVFITYVCVFQASATLRLIDNVNRRKWYSRTYKTMGVAMLVSPIVAFLFTSVFSLGDYRVFFVESFGVWVFAAYWALKSWEIHATQADEIIETRKILTTKPDGLADIFRQASVRYDDDEDAKAGSWNARQNMTTADRR
jgi:hypothetical protein